MDSISIIWAAAKAALPPNATHLLAEAWGWVSLFTQLVPWLLTAGPVAAVKAADWLFGLAARSPLWPLIRWKAPDIVKFLLSFKAALEKLLDTFTDRLDADLEAGAAAAPATAAPASPAPSKPAAAAAPAGPPAAPGA